MFRFTIRDLLWLMVVVGVALAWWADGVKVRAEKQQAEQDAADFWRPKLPPKRTTELILKYSSRDTP